MKEILSSQLDAVSGGWQDRDGSGKRSSDNGGSGSSSRGGNNGGDRGLQSFLSKNSPYGSGSGAGGFWGCKKWVRRQWHWAERSQRIRNQTLINRCNPSTEVKFCAFMGYMMNRYVVFIKSDESKVLRKDVVTREIIKDMKRKGFRKHHVEVEADNESDAINKLNKNSNDYLDSLKNFSGDLLLCSICVIVMAIVYFFS